MALASNMLNHSQELEHVNVPNKCFYVAITRKLNFAMRG